MEELNNLLPADIARLHSFRITDLLIALHGLVRCTTTQARQDYGLRYRGDLAGVVFPVFGADGEVKSYRVRRDHPEIEDGRPKGKYIASLDAPHLFFEQTSRQFLTDTSVPVVFVEAFTSALAIAAWCERTNRRLLIIALGGCWGWRGRTGKVLDEGGTRVDEHGASPDLVHIPLHGRQAFVVLDSNITTNTKVQAAGRAFTRELQQRGALVHLPILPAETNLNGPDDFLALHSDDDLSHLLDSTPRGAAADDEELLRRLASLSLLEYDREREAAAAELNCRMSSLDKEVASRRPKIEKDNAGSTGRSILLNNPEPAEEPVDGVTLADHLRQLFEKYIVMPAGASIALALFVIHTFAFDAAEATPIMGLLSPERRCGKTLILELLIHLVRRPLTASNISPAALFRVVEAVQPSLLVDEVDSFLGKDNEELRGILNSGHRKPTAIIIRASGEDNEPKTFSTWAPKVLALIGKLPPTLEDRSIVVPMQRKSRKETRERFRFSSPALKRIGEATRRQLARWALDHFQKLEDADPELPEQLNDRAQDNWRPLIAIADEIGGDWPAIARSTAIALSGDSLEHDASPSIQLLMDIRTMFELRCVDRLASDSIVAELRDMEERPWPEWKNGKPITQTQLARILAPFSIRPKNIRIGAEVPKGYELTMFQDVFERYLPYSPSTPPNRAATAATKNKKQDLDAKQAATKTSPVADQNDDKPKPINRVADVADETGGFWKESI